MLLNNTTKLGKNPRLCKAITGRTYSEILTILPAFEEAELKFNISRKINRIRSYGGGRKPSTLKTPLIRLIAFLFYIKVYPTFDVLSFFLEIDRKRAWEWIERTRKVLSYALNEQIPNPQKRKLNDIEEVIYEIPELREFIVDGTEQRIRRPKYNQEDYYSGKKKYHSIKHQITINPRNKRITSISSSYKGKNHDYDIFKKSEVMANAPPGCIGMGDKGYIGVNSDYSVSTFITPKKKTRNYDLSDSDLNNNRSISSIRISVEHVISQLKIFGVLNQTYRCHLKRVNEYYKLISKLYNFKLKT